MIKILKKIFTILDLNKLKNDILKFFKKQPSILLEDPDSELSFIEAEENEVDDDKEQIVEEDEEDNIIEEVIEETKPEINNDNITLMSKNGFVTTDVLSVRSGPGVEYEVIGYLLENASVEIVGQHNITKWYKIVIDNTYGYISHKYVGIMNFVNNIEQDNREFGDGCEELDNEIIDGNHACCFKFNKAVITQYAGDEVGSYGKLVYDQHCASHNLPYGTLIYIPMFKGLINSTGLFTVMDTGGHGMDFDIYTKKDIGKINADVYVVSWGKGPIAWSYTEAINYYLGRGIVERFNSAWALYNKMGGCLINFWKFKQDDKTIKSKSWYGADRIKQI